MKSSALILILLASGCFAAVAVGGDAAPAHKQEDLDFFERKIRPVLVKHCYECHAVDADDVGGELMVDSREAMRVGGESGPALVPLKPKQSLVIAALRHEGLEMPPERRLPDNVIADFERWIEMGAPDPRDAKHDPRTKAEVDIAAGRQHWSFQQPQRHAAPVVKQQAWPRQPHDFFVLAKLEEAGMQPSAPANRRTLIRRLYFDLVALPPSPEAVERFVNDKSPDAYERLVDELLESQHFGERWARLWLDVARYAEDQAHIVGNNKSLFYPNAYLYRDWLIQALNQDMPFDQFVRLQLAADLVEPKSTEQLPALGFIGLGPKYYRRNDPEVMADEWEDRVDTVTRGLLGLTVACARCHDHKYDPIPTEDYYALAGIFASTEMYNHPLPKEKQPQQDDTKSKKDAKQKKDPKKGPDNALHIVRDKNPRDINVQIRGDVKNLGPLATRSFLQVLSSNERPQYKRGSGRGELAESIVSRDNPLTARVIVNRIWRDYFGRGLVDTPSNFGKLGETPSHPRLLDDLAVRFMENGWSLKWLHKQIAMSATYRQSSKSVAANIQQDPANELLGRMARRRLSIEAWRDSLLVASGNIDRTIGGKSITPSDPASKRRSVYAFVSRFSLDPMLSLFDFPDPNVHAAKRSETTTPLQKLFVMNNPFVIKQAEEFAARLKKEVPMSADAVTRRVELAYELLFARPVTETELKLGEQFVSTAGNEKNEAWQKYVQVLLASNEMLYVD